MASNHNCVYFRFRKSLPSGHCGWIRLQQSRLHRQVCAYLVVFVAKLRQGHLSTLVKFIDWDRGCIWLIHPPPDNFFLGSDSLSMSVEGQIKLCWTGGEDWRDTQVLVTQNLKSILKRARHWWSQSLFLTSGADRLPWPGRGSIITSVKLLARSSVELLEDTASATSKLSSVLVRTLVSSFRILFVGVLGSLKDKGTVWAVSKGFLSIPGMSSPLGVSLKSWKLPESWDRRLCIFFESVWLEGSGSRTGLGGSGDGLETDGGGEVSDFRVGIWGLAVITGLRRSRGDCLETEEVGGEKEFEETRSSERFLISTLSSAWTDLGLGIGVTLAGEVRRMESCVVKKFSLIDPLSQYVF